MRSHRGAREPPHRGPSSFSADVFFRGALASRRAATPSKKPGRYGARCDGIQYQPFRARPARGSSTVRGSYGLKLFSLSGRFVRVCKTVAKLLAAHSSWTLEMRCLQNSTGSNDELSSFFIRYATHATISARNRESGFPTRRRRAHHFLTSDGSADNMTMANVYQVIRMEKTRDERKRSMRTINQIAFSCSLSRLDTTKGCILGRVPNEARKFP